MLIGEVARLAGVGVQTVRYYEREGLLPTARSTGSVREWTRPIRHEIGNPSRAWRTAGARTSAQGSRPHRDQLSHHASTQPGVVQDDADRRGTDAAP